MASFRNDFQIMVNILCKRNAFFKLILIKIACKQNILYKDYEKYILQEMSSLFSIIRDYGKHFMQKCLPYSETTGNTYCKGNTFMEIHSFINSIFRELGQIT